MGVTIVTSPPALSPLDRAELILEIDDTGTHPIYITGLYQLKDGSGAAIMPEKAAFRPVGGGQLPLSFRDELKGKVRAKLPSFGATGVQNDNTIIKEFKLSYGTKEVDVSVPFTAPTESMTDSAPFKVIASGSNVFDESVITDMTARILSNRPKNYGLFREGYDFIWLLNSGTVSYKFYKKDGSFTTLTQSAPYDVNIIPLNLNSLAAPMDTVTLEARIQSGSLDETYTLDLEENCQGDRDNFIEILYIEPPGGQNIMSFEDITDIGASNAQNIISINRNEFNVDDMASTGGDDIIYKKSYPTFSFKKKLKGTIEELEMIYGFNASNLYHMRLKKASGAEYWAKFILESPATYNPETKTLTASGRLARAIRSTNQV